MSNPTVSSNILSRLAALRRAVARWLFFRGAAILLVWLVALLAVELLLDWYFVMDKPQRIVCMSLIGLVVVYLLVTRLIRPMMYRLDDDILAVRVERKHGPELKQRLISALQFSRVARPELLGVSPQLMHATIDAGNEAAEVVRFDDVVDSQRYRRNVIITIVMLLVIGAAAVSAASGGLLSIWFNRNFLLTDDRYPRDTKILIDENADWVVARGDDWEPKILIGGKIPDEVFIDYEPLEGDDITQQMVRREEKAAKKTGIDVQVDTPVEGNSNDKKSGQQNGDSKTPDTKRSDAKKPDANKGDAKAPDAGKADNGKDAGDDENSDAGDGEKSDKADDADKAKDDLSEVKAVADDLDVADVGDGATGKSDVEPDPATKSDAAANPEPATDDASKSTADATDDADKTDTKKADTNKADTNKVDATKADADKTNTESESKTDAESESKAEAEAPEQVEYTALFKNVIQPFRFRIRAGDAKTRWITVRLVDRPAIEQFTLELEHPEYTGLGKETIWQLSPAAAEESAAADNSSDKRKRFSGTSSVPALPGSAIHFAAVSNKPLSRAVLTDGTFTRELELQDARVPGPNGETVDASRFSYVITPDELKKGTYRLELTDREQPEPLVSKRHTRFTVAVKRDKDPVVKAELLGISNMVVPEVRIPLRTYLRDDYRITAARLQYAFRGESEESAKGEDAQPFEGLAYGELDFTESPVEHVHLFQVEPLGVPINSNLTFHVEANDNDTVSEPETGKVGKSATFFVRVVDQGVLREDLIRRQAEYAAELQRLIKTQEDLITEIRIAISSGQGEDAISSELRSKLMQIQKRQKLVGDRSEGIAQQHVKIAMEFDNNKLDDPDSTIQRRLISLIILPLAQLNQQPGAQPDIGNELLPIDGVVLADGGMAVQATNLIDAARKAGNAAERERALNVVADAQQRSAAIMREVHRHMEKWSNYQEAVNLVYSVLREQGAVNRETLRAQQRKLQSLFPGSTRGNDGDKDN